MTELSQVIEPAEVVKKDKLNPVCQEVDRAMTDLEIPIGAELSSLFKRPEDEAMRYGGPFAMASGKMIRVLAERGPGNSQVYYTLFGINSERAWSDVGDYIDKEEPDLPKEEKRDLMLKELAEISGDPRAFYNLERVGENRPEFAHKGSELLWDLLENSMDASEKPGVAIPFKESVHWGNCKDSEFYLASTLPRIGARSYGARCAVYTDETGKPILYQKTGTYKIQVEDDFSNATAINLEPIVVNGVTLLPGTLIGIAGDLDPAQLRLREDQVFGMDRVQGVYPLRLTAFSMPNEDAKIAFGDHYQDFAEAFGSEILDIETFRTAATNVVTSLKK